ncbi:putative transcription factor bHLH family [Dioscorea sansibarensis]
MHRGVFHSSSVQQMMGGTSPNWWSSISNMKPPSGDETSLLYPLPSSSPLFHHYSHHQPSSLLLPPMFPFQDNQDLPESWSQLLLGGLVGEDADQRCVSLNPFQGQVVYSSASSTHIGGGDVKQESTESGYVYGPGSSTCDQIHAGRSCVTTSFSSNMLDFSNSNKAEKRQAQAPDHSSECNSTANGAAFKKARVQASSSAQSTFKVRKEKLGDRITALHQLVSPFGKTDTASVLLEAIGYIRFLQGQIEALSSPYLTTSSGSRRQSGVLQGETNCVFPEDPGQAVNDEAKKDLKSRGLCLVPVSCTLHVGSENGADYWAPTFGAGFR